jgi:predicted CXXCH cytochrome family protein
MTNKATFFGGVLIVMFVLLFSQVAWTTEAQDTYMAAYTGADATAVGATVCLACHSDKAGAEGDETDHVSALGDAATRCEGCHGNGSKHNGDVKGIINPSKATQAKVTTICTTCHATKGKFVKTEWVESKHFDGGLTCAQCHSGHSTNDSFLITATVKELCNNCHEDQVTAFDAGTHGAPNTTCNTCHNPHNN